MKYDTFPCIEERLEEHINSDNKAHKELIDFVKDLEVDNPQLSSIVRDLEKHADETEKHHRAILEMVRNI